MIKIARLPSAYQEVEWIQGTGTQYIDTGFTPANGNFEVVLDMQLTDASVTSPETTIYGTEGGTVRAGQFHLVTSGKLANNYAWHSPSPAFTADTNRHLVTFKPSVNKIIWDSTEYSYTSTTYGQPTVSHAIMWCGGGASSGYKKAKMKVWSCRIYNAGVLISSFVPCYEISSGTIGMYDVVKKVFKANAGTGVFSKGSNTASRVASISNSTGNIAKLSNSTGVFFRQILGGGYAERCDYLESAGGTQYIKLGENGSATTKVEIVTQFTGMGTSWTGLFGSDTSCAANDGFLLLYDSTNKKFRMNNGSVSSAISAVEKVKCVVEYNKATITRANGTNISITSSPAPVQTYPAEMYLFKINALDNDANFHRIGQKRIYYCKIYNGSTLTKNLVPCQLLRPLPPSKDSLGVAREVGNVGMWDTVGNKFYANAGTGEFNYGIYTAKSYIQSSGTQWINTATYPTVTTKVELVASSISTTGRQYLFGCYGGAALAYLYALDASSGSTVYFSGKNVNNASVKSISGTANLSMVNGVLKNGSTTLVTVTGYTTTMTCDRPLWIFNGSQSNYSAPATMRLHSFKMYDDGTSLSKSFVPCVLNRAITAEEDSQGVARASGTIGLWETVGNKFYANIGTGVFTAG